MDNSSRRLQERRELDHIAVARAKWELRFYCWRASIVLVLATAEVVDVILAIVEGRPPAAADVIIALLNNA